MPLLKQLLMMKAVEQRVNRQAKYRMNPTRGEFFNGLQNKRAVVKVRVRQYQCGILWRTETQCEAVIIQQIKIDGARAPAQAAFSSAFYLYSQKAAHQCFGWKVSYNAGDGVDIARLVLSAIWIGVNQF
jgi:hypothetical protein